ncbi:uncharacterized protein LOC119733034 [Patiria miniata]|uniref:Zinc finger PHD-type domain-containing protein n=1 Tax=Patiria miniata TaxID=46514 RepID=A0A914AFM9_PATMI|nr:uncharacterized protein LOC119733034 [Patiria miniata]
MIACDNLECDIAWFHYYCVGLTAETIPEDSWFCDSCRTDMTLNNESQEAEVDVSTQELPGPSKTDEAAVQSEPKSNPASSKKASKRRAKDNAAQKEPKKSNKKGVQRPVAKFSQEDAIRKASVYVRDGLLNIKSDPVYSASYPIALCIMALVTNLLTLGLIVSDRNSHDKPERTVNVSKSEKISKEEEQVLRYVAGYIPFALYKRFKMHKNKVAEMYCKLLSSWKVPSSSNTKTFLDYTHEWIKLQNRGGLFTISDELYIFFRTIENESRTLLTKANLDQFPGVNVKSSLFDKILAQNRVHTYWCSLTEGKIQGECSKLLLDIIVKYFIKIRCKAFIKVYLDLKKSALKQNSTQKKVSKKAEKALRKELASSTNNKVDGSV